MCTSNGGHVVIPHQWLRLRIKATWRKQQGWLTQQENQLEKR